jgi:predicted RNA-binding Zn-ribbon protein involved in translation (DUF1610 family)
MLDFECPKCKKKSEVDGGDIPDLACDNTEWECPNCCEITNIGWYATVEER